jgi:hypothetical protein
VKFLLKNPNDLIKNQAVLVLTGSIGSQKYCHF